MFGTMDLFNTKKNGLAQNNSYGLLWPEPERDLTNLVVCSGDKLERKMQTQQQVSRAKVTFAHKIS